MPIIAGRASAAYGAGFAAITAPPYLGPFGSYDSLSTVIVPSGGLASVTFAGIPTGYKHLQFRIFAQCNRGTVGIDALKFTFNGVTGTSYSGHQVRSDGVSTLVAGGDANLGYVGIGRVVGTTAGGTFGACVIDILDYSNTVKNKTIKAIGGVDINGTVGGIGGAVSLNSAMFMNTNAISNLTFTPDGGTAFNQYSSFALYGVK
jgi:hypothetical protein